MIKLDPQDREQVRLCILRYCLRPTATALIISNLRAEGYMRISRDEVEPELAYLSDATKGLLAAAPKAISPENKVWNTTATGRDFLAQGGHEA